jgi:membrane-bound metal-dependent hydrolase YbcI (DUF457 family)
MVHYGPLSAGPLDEPAHLATAALGLLVLARFIDVPVRFYVAALVASVAIDLDHIPLYLGLLGDQNERPFTHSLATVAVFTVAAAASRRHRAVLAGTATGLLLHFARDIVEGPPGVRMLWPFQQTAWTASYWWFLGMIILFVSARVVLVSVGAPHTRRRAFRSERDHRTVMPEQGSGRAPSADLEPGSADVAPEPVRKNDLDLPTRAG